jgi:DNA-binding helix-hairpin-helix protein with protein kinase domain
MNLARIIKHKCLAERMQDEISDSLRSLTSQFIGRPNNAVTRAEIQNEMSRLTEQLRQRSHMSTFFLGAAKEPITQRVFMAPRRSGKSLMMFDELVNAFDSGRIGI